MRKNEHAAEPEVLATQMHVARAAAAEPNGSILVQFWL